MQQNPEISCRETCGKMQEDWDFRDDLFSNKTTTANMKSKQQRPQSNAVCVAGPAVHSQSPDALIKLFLQRKAGKMQRQRAKLIPIYAST